MPPLNNGILHIGRDKTGTTAIQNFLAQNPEWLAKHGYFVPTPGTRNNAHHLLAESLTRRNLGWLKLFSKSHIINDMKLEIDKTDLCPIITSEAFQGCDAFLIKRIFPINFQNVIVYIRNQIDYLQSAYSQKIHATHYSEKIDTYYKNVFRVRYFKFLKKWENQFSPSLTVRIFDKSEFFEDDLIKDFVKHGLQIEDPISPIPNFKADPNPSLNGAVTEFKLYLNKSGKINNYNPNVLYRVLPKLNQQFSSPKVYVPENLTNHIINKCKKSEDKVAHRYFNRSELFDYKTRSDSNQDHEINIDTESMTEALKILIEEDLLNRKNRKPS